MPGKSNPSRWTGEHAIPLRPFCNWGIDFRHTVTGELSPNATGDYDTAGVCGTKNYGYRPSPNFYLWYDPPFDNWLISAVLGVPGNQYWTSDAGIIGTYSPGGIATGVATVAKGVFP